MSVRHSVSAPRVMFLECALAAINVLIAAYLVRSELFVPALFWLSDRWPLDVALACYGVACVALWLLAIAALYWLAALALDSCEVRE